MNDDAIKKKKEEIQIFFARISIKRRRADDPRQYLAVAEVADERSTDHGVASQAFARPDA